MGERLAKERKKREEECEEEKKEAERLRKVREQLDRIKMTQSNVKIDNKKVTELTDADILKIGSEKIEAARETQVKREQQTKVRDRKNERKRVDHVARALREEEKEKKLANWQDDVEEEDNEILNQAEEKEYDKLKQEHEVKVAEKNMLAQFEAIKAEWMDGQLEERYEGHLAKV